MNSAFCILIGYSQVIGKVLFTSEQQSTQDFKISNHLSAYCQILKVIFKSDSYSACVVYTKTIIYLSVGESGECLPCCFMAW